MKHTALYKETTDFIETLDKESKPLYELTPEEARDFLRNIQSLNHKEIKAEVYDAQIITTLAGIVSVRFIRPQYANEQKLPVIIYCHGGGFVMGDSYTHDNLIKKLAIKTGSCIAFINYSRSPESKFPNAFNQVYAVIDYIYNNPDEYNIDPEKIILMGDSAGANLIIASAIKLNKSGGIKPLANILLYPALDVNMNSKSYGKYENGPWLTKKAMKWFWSSYMNCKDDKNNIYFSPLNAKSEDLKGLSPVLILTAENDVLRDEGEDFALKLDNAGVKTACIRVQGTIHDFLMLNALKDTMQVKTSMNIINSFIRQAYASGF